MKKYYYLGIAIAMSLASCSNEELVNTENESKLQVSMETQNATRVGFDKTNGWAFYWNNGDKIWVNSGVMTTTTVQGKPATATFTGYGVNTTSGYAVYPHSLAKDNVSSSTFTLTLPEEYTYTELDEDFFASSQNVPMSAKVDNGKASFKHLGAIAAFKFNSWPFTGEHSFTLTASKKITGDFNIDLSAETPEYSAEDIEGENVVTVNFTRAEDAGEGTFVIYVPIPTGTYDIALEMTVDEETQFSLTREDKLIERSDIVWLEIGESKLEADCSAYKEVSSIDEVSDALSTTEEKLVVAVTEEVSGTENTITIPTDMQTEETTFSFASVADGAAITITEETSGTYTGKIVIEIPEDETIPTVTATVPNGEVYIKQGTVETLVVQSAENTTIIGAKAKIGTLTVNKGNVRLEDGATVTTINRGEGNTDEVTYVYFEGEMPTEANADAKIVYLSADFVKTSETSYEVSSVAGMQSFGKLVNAGNSFEECTIKLTNNLDLGNNQWTPIGTSTNPFKGTFDGDGKTIQNLSIVETEAVEGKAYVGFFGYATGATIKNVTFENVNLNIACLDIDHSQGHIGAVAGSLEGTSTIENVTVKGDVKVEATVAANGASRVAVVAGGNVSGNVTMKNVHVIANEGSYLKANNNVGALAGQLQEKNVFEDCSSNIDVTGTKFFAGGLIGLAAGNSTFTDCHTTGDITITAGRSGKANDHYRVGGIAGGWADNTSTPCVLTNCSYTGTISGTNADGSVAETLDYAGYVGRGYTLTNKAGSTVTIDGVSYIQAHNTIFGKYIVVKDGVYEVDNATELVNVWNFIEDGATVKLMDNITFDENNRATLNGYYEGIYYQGDKSFTIDLNEKAITNENGAINDYMVLLHNNGTKANTITIKNGKIDAGTEAFSAVASAKSNTGKLTIDLENVELTHSKQGQGATVKARGGSVLNVKTGTKIIANDGYTCLEAVSGETVVNIYNGSEFYQNGTTSYVGSLVGTSYGATVNVYGGKGVSKKSALFVYTSGGTLNAMGGEWTGNSDGTVPTPEGDNNSNVLVVQNNTNESGYVGASIMNVTGGTYKGGVSACGYTNTSDAQLHIKGGTFNTNPTNYLEYGYIVKEGTQYEVVMDAVAKIGSTEYPTLQAAFDSANDGEIITLVKDITIESGATTTTNGYVDGVMYTGDKSFTVDFNGKIVTDDGCVNDYLIYVNNKGSKANEITFKNGTMTVSNAAWSALAVNSNSSTNKCVVNLNDMTVNMGNPSDWNNDILRARKDGTLNLNNGTTINSKGTAYGATAHTGGILNINSGAKIVQTDSKTSEGNYPYTAVSGNGTINVYDGAVIESDNYGIHNMTTGNTVVNIYGGTITATIYALWASTNGASDQSANFYVTGGSINGALGTYSDNGHIVVSGGTFTADPTAYLVEGYTVTESEGSYTVSKE